MSIASLTQLRPARTLLDAAEEAAGLADPRAEALDRDFAFPEADVGVLHRVGLLLAPFPRRIGGENVAAGDRAAGELGPVLRRIGAANLSLGRLYEGHVNAAALVARYGREDQIRAIGAEAARGALLGVWNSDDAEGLRLVATRSGVRLRGRKILCSGAGFIERPLVTAVDDAGRALMVMPRLPRGERADLSSWTPQGMRASATGAVDFTDLEIHPDDIIGEDGDYQRQPAFSGGAWRFAAVQAGGMEKLLGLLREHLERAKRGGDPHQAARLGACAIAVESARLWVERAARIAETGSRDADSIVAYVNLARIAVERCALDLLELTHRSVGLASFMRPSPIERVSRDLSTYLRQPGPDRALTSAAAWVLDQHAGAAELWR
jgi:alkylation response protein AidB-like acyl-CoA dehydrogenase